MENEILELFEKIGSIGNCRTLAIDLSMRLTERGYFSEIKRVSHKSNVIDEKSFSIQHVCGENYTQHFVVNYNGLILDSKLDSPVPEKEYIEKAYKNHEDLMMS